MSFSDIFCQDRAVNTLQRAFAANRAAHAYIFAGPDGVGKFKTATEWAKLLLCREPVIKDNLTEACGCCEPCRLFETGSNPDMEHIYKELLEFTREGKNKTPPVDMPIDVIREFLIEKAGIRPSVSQRKVYIISEAEKLNISSQNALLKILEEPPLYCCIVMICTRLDTLLPTIRSRCQIVRFGPVQQERIMQKLLTLGLNDVCCGYFARLAQGSIGSACQWVDLELAEANLYQSKCQLIESLTKYQMADVLDLAEEIIDKGKKIAEVWISIEEKKSQTDLTRKAAQILITMVISALYDVTRIGIRPAKEAINYDQYQLIEKLAGRFDRQTCMEKIADCYQMLQWVESSVNEKLIWEHLLLNLANSGTINKS
jgi:DNA polymerase III subunit delta'